MVEWDADVVGGIGYCPICGVSRHHAIVHGHCDTCELDQDLKFVGLLTESQREAAREDLILERGTEDWRRASRDARGMLS